MTHDIFISHSSKDKNAASAICHALEKNGIKCWIAPRDVSPGREYAEELIYGIKNAKLFLLIFSKDSNESKPVSKEIESAFRYEKTVIPFRIEDVEMRESLEYYLSNLHWLDAFPDDNEFDSLVKVVKKTLGMKLDEPIPPVATSIPEPAPVQQRVCPSCNAELAEGMIFCNSCGAKYEPVATPAPIPVMAASPAPVQEQYIPQQPAYAPPPPPQQPAHTPPVQEQVYVAPVPVPEKKKKPVGVIIGIIAAAVLVLSIGTVGIIALIASNNNNNNYQSRNDDDETRRTTAASTDDAPDPNAILTPVQIFDNNKHAVFQIKCYHNGVHVGWGSGFFVNAEGVAITNHHVMEGMTGAVAVLFDGREFDITGYYSYDFSNDYAVIQVDGKGESFSFVTIGDSDSMNVGDSVYALGGPDGDPITFTAGMISRFANEPLNYGRYTVAGMLQSTAAVYGGNSGGPLLNDKGHVIGINSASDPSRDSQQWAVPIKRVILPSEGNNSTTPLPVGGGQQDTWDGTVTYLARYSFIPDFLSVSRNAYLGMAGTASDLGFNLVLDFDVTGSYHFDYAYYYLLEEPYFISDTDEYDDVLEDHGFDLQGAYFDDKDGITYVFFYLAKQNTSLVYSYYWEYEILVVVVGSGNAYQQLSGGSASTTTPQTPTQPAVPNAYQRFPAVPDFGKVIKDAKLIDEGYLHEFGLEYITFDGNYYGFKNNYLYIYDLDDLDDVFVYLDDYLLVNNFDERRETYYEDVGVWAALYYNSREGVWVSVLYYVDYSEAVIVIELDSDYIQ
ncbi:MAG: trypsin-like peptidase domain-containing protein [Oscillospiraceae bacterium]|nr:trypsin-like peptidase domain-containing protein [Oscillospiraceae bacterium]